MLPGNPRESDDLDLKEGQTVQSDPEIAPRVLVMRWNSLEKSPHVATLLNFLARQKFAVTIATVDAVAGAACSRREPSENRVG